MKYFSTFSGAGGFELGIQYAMETNQKKTQCTGQEDEEAIRGRQYQLADERREGLGNCDGTGLCEQSNERSPRQLICVGFSEIDRYASAVLKYHYPNIKNYGDISKIDWNTVPDFDLLVGGSPCQDLSVAGKRKGLTGERSGLFAEFIRALQEKKPEYFIWENVKGALSSNTGWDFAAVQIAFSEAGYSLWWQVLNAKDFGVPQNRERIFVVGTRTGSPREILFERGTDKEDSGRIGEKVSYAIDANYHKGTNTTLKGRRQLIQLNKPKHSNDRVYSDEGISPTLNTMQGGNRQPFVSKTIRVGGQKSPHRSKQNWDSYEIDGKIRRLTPTECERLMSWHSTAFYAKISLCLDQANSFVSAVNKNPKLRGLVLNVENEPEIRLAKTVAQVLSQNALLNESFADESATTNGQEVNKNHQSKTEKTSSVNSADKSGLYEFLRIEGGSAHCNVGVSITEGRTIRIGKEALLLKEDEQTHPLNGNGVYELFGNETMQLVNDVKTDFDTNPLKSFMFTTSDRSSISISDLIATILYFYAKTVTDSSTHERIKPKTLSLFLKLSDGWTRYGNFDGEIKEISDTQRYKMCGNGVVSLVVQEVMNKVICQK